MASSNWDITMNSYTFKARTICASDLITFKRKFAPFVWRIVYAFQRIISEKQGAKGNAGGSIIHEWS